LEHFLNHTIDLREKQNVIDIARKFVLGVMDRIAANLIDDPLGNGGHLGTGIFGTSQSPLTCFSTGQWATDWWWHNRMSLEYLWPKTEKRFFINQNDPQSFANRDFTDVSQAAANLLFLQNELINRVYLLALNTMVQPGLIFRWTSSFNYITDCWNGRFGGNLWVQQAEKLYNKSVSPCSTTTIGQINALDKCKVRAPVALQLKLFGDISYTFSEGNIAWTIGANGDITAVKYGIGRDYTVGLFIEASF
jgi:hypothetical protein